MPTLECPICRRKVRYTSLAEVPYRPFCSSRCQYIDLGNWLNEVYRVREEPPDLSRVHDSQQPPDGEPAEQQ